IHYWDDYYVVEIVDPESGRVLPEGEEGEVVLTTLRKEAMPLVRYRTRDISRIIPGACACGSRHPRLARLTGRSDDMVKVRGVQGCWWARACAARTRTRASPPSTSAQPSGDRACTRSCMPATSCSIHLATDSTTSP